MTAKQLKKQSYKRAVIFIAVAFIVVAFTLLRQLTRPPATPIPSQQTIEGGASYQGIAPGKSSADDVKEEFGEHDTTNDDKAMFFYNNNFSKYPNTFNFNAEGEVILVREIVPVDGVTFQQLEEKYGKYEEKLYSPISSSGYDMFIHPSKGVSYLANETDGNVLEIWYFEPQSAQSFIANIAPDYSFA